MDPSNRQSYRGVQRSPGPGTSTYKKGKKRTALSIYRYHILCAAIQKKYTVEDVAAIIPYPDRPDIVNVRPRMRVTIYFRKYKEFKLRPLKDIEILDPNDETAHDNYMKELYMYESTIRDDWRTREGGVLRALAEYGDFFDCMSQYHSSEKTTRIHGWDELFEQIQKFEFRKNAVPCMFFGQREGCLDRNCPFLHDREATLADRAMIIKLRRMRFDYKHCPSERQHMIRHHSILDHIAGDDKTVREQMATTYRDEIRKDIEMDRAYCGNRRCMRPWKKGQKNPLRACKGCKYTMYCSRECQKLDWQRHKEDPCAAVEDIIANDDMWDATGFREGTTFFMNTRAKIAYSIFAGDGSNIRVTGVSSKPVPPPWPKA